MSHTRHVTPDKTPAVSLLRAHRLGLFTQHESIVVMRTDCHVCRSEGLRSRSQVVLCAGDREVHAILYQIQGDLIGHDEAALSERAWKRLGVKEGDEISVRHPPESSSLSSVRRRMYGSRLDDTETIALVRAMVDVGDKLTWPSSIIVDKHCVGGLPGNRTTPIVVAIVAASGLLMPKTSSRAITSPAGTADVMERRGDRNVKISVPELEGSRDHTPVLIDDIVASGRTMIEVSEGLLKKGHAKPVCVVVHALFAEDAYAKLSKLTVMIASTDTVPHASNCMSVASLLAQAI